MNHTPRHAKTLRRPIPLTTLITAVVLVSAGSAASGLSSAATTRAPALAAANASIGQTPRPASAQRCPVSQPGGPRPPRTAMLNGGTQLGSTSNPRLYGNGTLWTTIPMQSYYTKDRHSGSILLKTPWFRARAGTIHLTAVRVAGQPGQFHANVGTAAEYGPTGFAASLLTFGEPGCWRVRATLARRALSVVLNVPSR